MPGSNIFEKSVCLSVTLGRLGTRRGISSEAVDVDADKSLVHVAKDILEAEELEAIKTFDGVIRRYLAGRCLPSLFRAGVYLLPMGLITEVDQALEEFRRQRRELVDRFCEAYPRIVKDVSARLRALHSKADYPPVEDVRAAFYLGTEYLTFSVPALLEEINAGMFERERAKAERRITEAQDTIIQALREAFAGLVTHMVDRLKPAKDGKPRTFRNTLVTNMEEFLSTFAARNIAEDGQLAELVQRAQSVLKGVDAEGLRSDDDLRVSVRKGFEQMKQVMDTMVVEKGTRSIRFDDEEEAAA